MKQQEQAIETRSDEPRAVVSRRGEYDQAYGERVHLLRSPSLETLLSRLGGLDIRQPELVTVLRTIYGQLFLTAIDGELATVPAEVPTRMQPLHPAEGVWRGDLIDPSQQLTFVDVIRAGLVPSQLCYELAASLLPDEQVRIDHLNMARLSDSEGRVVGVDLSGSKVGGSVEGHVLVLPDPMGATGSTTRRVIDHYVGTYGKPRLILALPMIATPEYLAAVLEYEDLVVYTARLDRGLSSAEVLGEAPGVRWAEERGLNDQGYIVPGAGGVGEVLNNAWC
ncbi:MAG: uracil phosphoribosyltransferase [Planctomycetota bacterium]|nr:uracil phosphoribosyltransferase [Planctomycetota bacterium]